MYNDLAHVTYKRKGIGFFINSKVLQIKAGGRLGTAEYRLYIEFCVSVGDKVHYRRLKISLRHLANYT